MESEITGKLGKEISIEEGYEAVRLTAIDQIIDDRAEWSLPRFFP